MAEAFDPYEKWLGIPKDKRPLTSYRLLGVEIFETDTARITRRAERRIQLVTRQQKGKHGATAKKVLKQLVEARDTLLDATKKEKYDRMLRKRLGNGVPQPPPAPVQVEADDDDGSTDDLSMFNFAANSSDGGGGGSYGGYDPVESRKGGLNQNFWVMPVAIGTSGLVLLLIAFLLMSGEKVVEPVDTAKAAEDGKKKEEKEAPKGFGELVSNIPTDPAKTEPPKELPKELSKEALIDTWISAKVDGDLTQTATIRDRSIKFNKDGTYTQTTSKLKDGVEAGQEVIAGKFKLIGEELTTTPNDPPDAPAALIKVELKDEGKMLVLNNENQQVVITYTRAPKVDPNAPVKRPEPEVDPEPETVVWTVNDDPPEDGVPEFVTAEQFKTLKPEVKVGSVAISPSKTLVAFGANKGNKIQLLTVDGTTVATCEAKGDVLAVAVPSPEMIIAWTTQGMQVFSGTTGEATTTWNIPVSGRSELGMAVSGKGKYFAICRKGIRIYHTQDGELKGLIKTPKGQQEVAFAFSRDGKELVVIYQKTTVPYGYRIVPHTLLTGQPDPDLTRERPGNLLDTTGPLGIRLGNQNRKYLFVGNRYVVNGDDGRVVSILVNPADHVLPLDLGNFYTFDKNGAGTVAGIPFTRLDESVRAFGQSVGGIHLCPEDPENPVAVQVDASGAGNSASLIQSRLERVLAQRLQEDGMRFDATASKRLVVTYKESPGPKSTQLQYVDKDGLVQNKKYDNPFTTYQAQVTVRWTGEGWSQPFGENTNLTSEAELNGEPSKIFAAGLLENVAGSLSGMVNIPYFIAETPLEGIVTLPLVFDKLGPPSGGGGGANTPEANAL